MLSGAAQQSETRMWGAWKMLCLLLLGVIGAARGDAHSLCYNFTVAAHPTFGQRWCTIQGQMNAEKFLDYDCVNDKIQPCGFLGKEINASKTWIKQIETLRHVKDVLKQYLANIKSEISTVKDPLSLQGNMLCQKEANGHTHGSWTVSLDGQKELLFNSMKGKWKPMKPKGRSVKKLGFGKDLATFLKKVSLGDCRDWLENFLVDWNEELEATAPPVIARSGAQSETMTITSVTWILSCSIILFIQS